MQLTVSPIAFDTHQADALVVFVQDGAPLSGALATLDVALGGAIARAMVPPRFSAKAEAVVAFGHTDHQPAHFGGKRPACVAGRR